MNDVSGKSGATNAQVEEQIGTFNTVTAKVLNDLGELATQFNTHGRSLAEAVELLERATARTADGVARAADQHRDARFDARHAHRRFRAAACGASPACSRSRSIQRPTRAREIARIIAETSSESVRTIEQQFELVRTTSEEERKRTGETLNAVYDQAAAQVHGMFSQSATRFTEIVQGMKQMAGEMQRELEATRAELRRGILELPQETADSAAQMRRVIVDQIEALAELNRIVARHGRGLDASEPARREAEPMLAIGGGARPSGAATAAARRSRPAAARRSRARRRLRPCAATSPARRRAGSEPPAGTTSCRSARTAATAATAAGSAIS